MKLFVILLLVYSIQVTAENKYPVNAIPEEMKQGANVVIRDDDMVFTILAKNKATWYVHFAVTILNEKGNSYAQQVLGYSKLLKVNSFDGVVYDASGKQIKKLKSGEIYDQASFDGFTLFADNRMKIATLTQATYPYTVEFTYEMEFKYLYSIPASAFGGEKRSTMHATYELVYPTDLAPRYKLYNSDVKPDITLRQNGIQSIKWTFENIMPFKFESYGPPAYQEIIPHIIAAPASFEYEGYPGNMSTWQEYGKWNGLLNKDRDALPPGATQKVQELTKGLTTTEQKAKAIYEYMQGKTRYVGIQLGIGGLQPFPASVVDETGYGDCKALSNYMVAMLKAVGIKGYYTTIYAGEGGPDVNVEFPSHQFNHVIVAVPNGKDTLWMECTSQSKSFGYMGKFTSDRLGLMITDEGGKLVKTPTYTADQNKQFRTANVTVDATGNAKAIVKTTYGAIQSEAGGLDDLLDNQFDNQKKWIENHTEIPNFALNSFSIKGNKGKIPTVTVNADLTLNRYASVSGKRLFLTPNLMNKMTYVPEKSEDRKTDVVRSVNYLDIDTIKLSYPENLYPEFLPPPVKIASRFGEYETNYQIDEGKLVYIRKMKVWKGRFPKESYNELVDFYKNINKSDNVKVVFLSKT